MKYSKMPSFQIRSLRVPDGASRPASQIRKDVSRHSGPDSGLSDAGASTLAGADANLQLPHSFWSGRAAPGAPVAPSSCFTHAIAQDRTQSGPAEWPGRHRERRPSDFIANQQAAIQLGKVFFWEMQAGSDNKTACATCHFKAGEDGRDRNQMNPGANGNWDGFGYGPNYTLIANDFPLTNLPTKDVDNIIGSQGVRMSQFTGFSKSGAETTTPSLTRCST